MIGSQNMLRSSNFRIRGGRAGDQRGENMVPIDNQGRLRCGGQLVADQVLFDLDPIRSTIEQVVGAYLWTKRLLHLGHVVTRHVLGREQRVVSLCVSKHGLKHILLRPAQVVLASWIVIRNEDIVKVNDGAGGKLGQDFAAKVRHIAARPRDVPRINEQQTAVG